MASKLCAWLGSLTAEQLAEILTRRPDAAAAPYPRTLGELAERLQSRLSVTAAFQALPQPAVQVIEALQALGGPEVGRERLAHMLGRADDDPDLAATLEVLALRALVWPDGSRLQMAGPLWSAFRHPLRLGPPARRLYGSRAAAEARRTAISLRLPAGRTKQQAVHALAGWAADAERVRDVVDSAPPGVRALLHDVAWDGPTVSGPGIGYGQPDPAVSWALDRGLLVADGWHGAVMPGEIGAALRGPEWHAPFNPYPPEPALLPVAPEAVAREAAAAAGAAVTAATTLLDACAATPVTLLKAGGVGSRELRRLAKALGAAQPVGGPRPVGGARRGDRAPGDRAPGGRTGSPGGSGDPGGYPIDRTEADRGGSAEGDAGGRAGNGGEAVARLWLELAAHAGLLARAGGEVLPTDAYDDWCAAEPAPRLVRLLRAWLTLPAAPLAHRDAGGDQPAAALTYHMLGEFIAGARRELLRAAAGVPAGHGVADEAGLTEAVVWRSPLLLGGLGDAAALVSASWREATLLGVVAHGALTPLGRALLAEATQPDGGASTLEAAATRLMPAAVPSALFQTDLTAVVPGTPAAALAALLDAAADRESRGGAVIWRFTPASVRRALDAGESAPRLLAALREVAIGGSLPQPLDYLVGDVARRHGKVRVRTLACVVHGDDTSLLAEIAAARSLAPLRLTLLAPTVLGSGKPAGETLAALRAAGYAPVAESPGGEVVVERAARRRAPAQPRRDRRPARAPAAGGGAGPTRVDAAALARTLLTAGAGATHAGTPRAGVHLTGAGTGAGGIAAAAAGGSGLSGRGRPAHLHLVPDHPANDGFDDDAGPDGDDVLDCGDGFDDDAPATDAVVSVADPATGAGEDLVAVVAPQLNRAERRLLADALAHAAPVKIFYTNAQGNSSVRVIEPLNVHGRLLEAWCHLRDEERMFALDRIDAVSPA